MKFCCRCVDTEIPVSLFLRSAIQIRQILVRTYAGLPIQWITCTVVQGSVVLRFPTSQASVPFITLYLKLWLLKFNHISDEFANMKTSKKSKIQVFWDVKPCRLFYIYIYIYICVCAYAVLFTGRSDVTPNKVSRFSVTAVKVESDRSWILICGVKIIVFIDRM
jgi:hypothetical protein